MRSKFVKTANVKRFLAGIGQLEERGAPEASLMLVSGDAGHGKSRTAAWWSVQSGLNACFIRLKAAATPHWLLTDLVRELNETAPAHSCEKLFAQAIGVLVTDPRPIVVDEIEAGLKDIRVIETLRDISDVAEVPVVMVGREYVGGALRRHSQIDSRISARVDFHPVTAADVDLLAAELCQVTIAEDLRAHIHAESGGRVRNVVKALANAERAARRKGKDEIGIKDIQGKAPAPAGAPRAGEEAA